MSTTSNTSGLSMEAEAALLLGRFLRKSTTVLKESETANYDGAQGSQHDLRSSSTLNGAGESDRPPSFQITSSSSIQSSQDQPGGGVGLDDIPNSQPSSYLLRLKNTLLGESPYGQVKEPRYNFFNPPHRKQGGSPKRVDDKQHRTPGRPRLYPPGDLCSKARSDVTVRKLGHPKKRDNRADLVIKTDLAASSPSKSAEPSSQSPSSLSQSTLTPSSQNDRSASRHVDSSTTTMISSARLPSPPSDVPINLPSLSRRRDDLRSRLLTTGYWYEDVDELIHYCEGLDEEEDPYHESGMILMPPSDEPLSFERATKLLSGFDFWENVDDDSNKYESDVDLPTPSPDPPVLSSPTQRVSTEGQDGSLMLKDPSSDIREIRYQPRRQRAQSSKKSMADAFRPSASSSTPLMFDATPNRSDTFRINLSASKPITFNHKPLQRTKSNNKSSQKGSPNIRYTSLESTGADMNIPLSLQFPMMSQKPRIEHSRSQATNSHRDLDPAYHCSRRAYFENDPSKTGLTFGVGLDRHGNPVSRVLATGTKVARPRKTREPRKTQSRPPVQIPAEGVPAKETQSQPPIQVPSEAIREQSRISQSSDSDDNVSVSSLFSDMVAPGYLSQSSIETHARPGKSVRGGGEPASAFRQSKKGQATKLRESQVMKITSRLRTPPVSDRLLVNSIREGNRSYSSYRQEARTAMQRSPNDSLRRWKSWKGASHDVMHTAWSLEGTKYAVGTAALTDRHTMQYNRPNNLLLGNIVTSTLRELPDHHTPRPGAASSIEDPRLFQSISALSWGRGDHGDRLYTASYDQMVKIWNVEQESTACCLKSISHRNKVVDIAIATPSIGLFATGTSSISDGIRVVRYEEANNRVLGTYIKLAVDLPEGRTAINYTTSCMQYGQSSSTQDFFAAGLVRGDPEDGETPVEGHLGLWRLIPTEFTPLKLQPHAQNVFDIAWHPYLPYLATGNAAPLSERKRNTIRSTVRVYDPTKCSRVVEYDCPAVDLNTVTFCPTDSNYITASATDGITYVWDYRRSDKILHQLQHGDPLSELRPVLDRESCDTGVNVALWGRETTQFYTGGSDGVLKEWNIKHAPEDVLTRDVIQLEGEIMSGAFSPNGSDLILGDAAGGVHLLSEAPIDEKPIAFVAAPSSVSTSPKGDPTEEDPLTQGRSAANELVVSGQIEIVPGWGAGKGPNYTGPWAKWAGPHDRRERGSRRKEKRKGATRASNTPANDSIIISDDSDRRETTTRIKREKGAISRLPLLLPKQKETANRQSNHVIDLTLDDEVIEVVGQESEAEIDSSDWETETLPSDDDIADEGWFPPNWMVDANIGFEQV